MQLIYVYNLVYRFSMQLMSVCNLVDVLIQSKRRMFSNEHYYSPKEVFLCIVLFIAKLTIVFGWLGIFTY